jgi:hypothetical protein
LIPFVIELGGHIHVDSLTWLKSTLRESFSTTVTNANGTTSKILNHLQYQRAYRPLIERLQTTVQRSNAFAVMGLNTRARHLHPLIPPPQGLSATATQTPTPPAAGVVALPTVATT